MKVIKMSFGFTKDQVEFLYEEMKKEIKPSDSVMFIHRNTFRNSKGQSGMCLFNNTELKQQLRDWKKLAKQGELNILTHNSKSRTLYDGSIWHFLTIQHPNDDVGFDPLGMMLFGFTVTGLIYAFKSKVNRDRCQDYIMKFVEQKEE
tara:strand:+ start:151 stop:591 length:441 start_codon:yes stop_codon:yes gene_type:complete